MNHTQVHPMGVRKQSNSGAACAISTQHEGPLWTSRFKGVSYKSLCRLQVLFREDTGTPIWSKLSLQYFWAFELFILAPKL